jgi:hypothetical protein
MAGLRMAFRAVRRVLTGHVLSRINIRGAGGVRLPTLLLKRDERTDQEYVVLNGTGGDYPLSYCHFELEEFDRFIEAADDIWSAQTSPPPASAVRISRLTKVLTGQVLRRADVVIGQGLAKVSLRLKRQKRSRHEYVVLAIVAPSWYVYYPYEMEDFRRLLAGAKKLRASAQIDTLVLDSIRARSANEPRS